MDYSAFTEDEFDVKDWVNSAFRSKKDCSNDQYATTLVMKLQMFIQEVNNVVEESCQQAIQNLPRVMRELEAVQQEALLLQDQMTAVRTDIQKVEHDTSQSMNMLLQLDSIKTRMKEASEALQEADNWTTLSADVDQVFESQDITAISTKLVGMKQSLSVLTDVSDYIERCQFLETLKNRLEAMLMPQLVVAFNNQATDAASTYVRIFTDIDRLPQLCKYYHNCKKGNLMRTWRQILDEKCDETVMEWMNEFYESLVTLWHTEISWCSQLFGDHAMHMLCELITDVLTSLGPEMNACIEKHLQTQAHSLAAIIDLKQISERFSKNIENAVDSKSSAKPEVEHLNDLERLSASIFLPFQSFISGYRQLEESTLCSHLDKIILDHSEPIDCVRLLVESVNKLFTAANKANERCIYFTNGCGYVSLFAALKTYFNKYLIEFSRVLTNLREKCPAARRCGVEGEDWSWFQNSLRIIQTCGDLLIQLDELDLTLMSDMVRSVTPHCHLPMSPTRERGDSTYLSPFHDYPKILLAKREDRAALEAMYVSIDEGDSQSVLDDTRKQLCILSVSVHQFAYDIVFAPLRSQLSDVPNMDIWQSETAGGALASELPSFSLSPQEYITKAGQYLLTLPLQLEPFTLEENPSLIAALKHGKLPHATEQDLSSAEHLADVWLESVARGTMHTYCEQVLKINNITRMATRQLTTDINYLSNVLDDLGLTSSDLLRDLVTLLEAEGKDFDDIARNKPQRLISAVAAMRQLKLN